MSAADISQKIAEYRKALAAFLIPGLTAYGVAAADDVVTQAEWIAVAIAALGSSGVVALVPNRTPRLRVRLSVADVKHYTVKD